MDDVQFLNWITPRIGPVNAINAAHSAKTNALVELLIEKGFCSRKEVEEKYSAEFQKIQKQILSMPVVSPIQNRSPQQR